MKNNAGSNYLTAGIFLTGIFILDLYVPLGVAVGALYTVTLLMLFRTENFQAILFFATVASIMTILAWMIHHSGEINWMVLVNRLISILVIWMTFFMVIWHRKLAEASEEALRKQMLLIEKKNSELEQFTYITSHDLQEPLRTVKSFVALVQKDSCSEEMTKSGFRFINESVIRMSDQIASLHQYSVTGVNSKPTEVDCNQLIKSIEEDLATVISEKKVTITVDLLPVIRAYKIELGLLFQNLISNAIKFQSPGNTPEISISSTENEDTYTFRVKDNGIGLDQQYHDKIFLIFQRLHTRDEYSGSGIGLAHCKKIADLHGGTIWLESEPNVGSIFYFTIPKRIDEK